MDKKRRPIVSVDLIVTRGNEILLGRVGDKWAGKRKYEWGLPGREIDFKDSFKDTIKKNLKKDTGLVLKNFRVFCVNNNFGFGNHYIAIGILVKANGEPIVMEPEDWKEWAWFPKNSIPRKLFPSAQLTIECFVKNKVSVKSYG